MDLTHLNCWSDLSLIAWLMSPCSTTHGWLLLTASQISSARSCKGIQQGRKEYNKAKVNT
jgi:hypothetical protein